MILTILGYLLTLLLLGVGCLTCAISLHVRYRNARIRSGEPELAQFSHTVLQGSLAGYRWYVGTGQYGVEDFAPIDWSFRGILKMKAHLSSGREYRPVS